MMDSFNGWIEHLENPLVLLGFVLIVFAGLLKLFKTDKLNGRAIERLMNRGMIFTFILGVLIIGFAFADSFLKPKTSNQAVKGNTGTVMQSGGEIFHNKGDGTLSTKSEKQTSDSGAMNQTVEDNQGTVYQSTGDTHVQESK